MLADTPTRSVEVRRISYSTIDQIAHRDLAYIQEAEDLQTFYKYKPEISEFENVINDKSKEEIDRKLLVDTLLSQYENLDLNNLVGEHIKALGSAKTFTVVTAHQPSLFTGPLYYIYKIISAIHLTRCLADHYPDYSFVPVFVTGGEDHDFEEVNHIHLFGKKLTWENEASGAVGMMHTKSVQPVLEELKSMLGDSEEAKALTRIFEESLTNHTVYSDAVVEMLHRLFCEFGLVVLNMNQAALKAKFTDIIKDDLLHQTSARLVQKTVDNLESKGYAAQATPRAINLFYLKDQLRERIVFENDKYKVLNTTLEFTKSEILEEVNQHPERFSPNVVLRPLYQERILPNLAYVGGGGELAYWLERKQQFEHFNINFPVLVRRNSVLWIDGASAKKMDKLSLSIDDVFLDTEFLIKKYVEENTQNDLTLAREIKAVGAAYDAIAQKAFEVDPTLKKAVLAEKTRQLKTVEQLESRLMRAEKQKHETAINQIRSIKERLFPNNGLQERHDNFIPIYLKHGPQMFHILLKYLNPLEREFLVLKDN